MTTKNNNLINNKEDAITNYKVHEISHTYWNYKSFGTWTKKLLMQYNSGTVFNSKFITPCLCKSCKKSESIKHCLMECNSLQTMEVIDKIKEISKFIKEELGINDIALGWEDNVLFNKLYAISFRGNVSIPLGAFIVKNKLEQKLEFRLFEYIRLINLEDEDEYTYLNAEKRKNSILTSKFHENYNKKPRKITPKSIPPNNE